MSKKNPDSGPESGQGRAAMQSPPYVVNDLLPDIILKNEQGSFVRISFEMTGRKLLLLLCPDPALPACRSLLEAFAARADQLETLAHTYVITNCEPEENRTFLEQANLPFLLLSDSQRQVAQGLAIDHNLKPATADGDGAFTVVVADENRRVTLIERNLVEPEAAVRMLEFLQRASSPIPKSLGHFAPVLYVPQVLEPDFCRELIEAFEAGDPMEGHTYSHDGQAGRHVVDPDYKIRRDFYVTDRSLLDRLRLRMLRRVIPEIAKALTRQVTGIEEFKVVCYEGARGGHFSAHRDNNSKHHAHRRFAMTLNLNTGFEGGALRFPEYGPDLYSPDAGDAVIFSCSLLHEAMPVTSGQRFVLLSFLFDEESRQFNDRFRRQAPPGA